MFEPMGGGDGRHPGGAPGRYHLTLTTAGRTIAQGWWGNEAAALGKVTEWVGDWGRPGARVTLVDEETGETLTE